MSATQKRLDGQRLAVTQVDKGVGEVKAAKDDGRLPMEDHNTRIIVFGGNGVQAKALAEAIVREAFQHVVYFGGSAETLLQRAAGR